MEEEVVGVEEVQHGFGVGLLAACEDYELEF